MQSTKRANRTGAWKDEIVSFDLWHDRVSKFPFTEVHSLIVTNVLVVSDALSSQVSPNSSKSHNFENATREESLVVCFTRSPR